MIEQIKALLPFLAGLGVIAKISITLIVLCAAALILLALWVPEQLEVKNTETKKKPAKILPQDAENTSRNTSKKSSPTTGKLSISLQEYFVKVHSFGDRYQERDQFHTSNRNKAVDWRGYITQIQSFGEKVSATISVAPGSGDTVFVVYESSFREFLFSLRQGDQVRFEGVIYSGPITKPELNGSQIERLP